MWNHSTCNCECDNAYKTDEYLDIKSCSCEKYLKEINCLRDKFRQIESLRKIHCQPIREIKST